MIPIALAAALFSTPVADAELALAVTQPSGPVFVSLAGMPPYQYHSTPTQEQIDNWWADDGAALIAEAVRPRPTMQAGLDLQGLRLGDLSVRLAASASMTTSR